MSEYLESILNAFHDMLFVFTTDGIIDDYLTTNHQDELGLSKEAFLGKHHSEVLPPYASEKLQEAFKAVERGVEQFSFDYSMNIRGDKQWYTAVISKLELDQKQRYLGTIRNITGRKNQELLLRGILNTTPAGIVVFDALKDEKEAIYDYEIANLNELVEKLLGAPEEELIGQTLTAITPDLEIEKMMDRFNTVIEKNEPIDFDYKLKNEDNESRWFHCKATKFKDGIIISFLDITEQRETRDKLIAANAELEELNRQKDKLFSVISHDLKNAISGPMALFEVLLEEYEALSSEEIIDYLKSLNRSNENVVKLLEDLLMWSKNQFQEVKPFIEEVKLRELTDNIFRNVKAGAEEKKITLKNRVPENITLHTDISMLKTILRNLVGNGIKFSHQGGTIEVKANQDGTHAKISVSDEGVGIENEAMEKILNKKSNYTTRGTSGEKGSGLGLDLCIDFTEKLGGTLHIESKPEAGSTFHLALPNDK